MEVLFRIGPLNIYKLGFFTAIGLLAGLYIAMKEARRVIFGSFWFSHVINVKNLTKNVS